MKMQNEFIFNILEDINNIMSTLLNQWYIRVIISISIFPIIFRFFLNIFSCFNAEDNAETFINEFNEDYDDIETTTLSEENYTDYQKSNEFIELRCKNCGSHFFTHDKKQNIMTCNYCKTKYIISRRNK